MVLISYFSLMALMADSPGHFEKSIASIPVEKCIFWGSINFRPRLTSLPLLRGSLFLRYVPLFSANFASFRTCPHVPSGFSDVYFSACCISSSEISYIPHLAIWPTFRLIPEWFWGGVETRCPSFQLKEDYVEFQSCFPSGLFIQSQLGEHLLIKLLMVGVSIQSFIMLSEANGGCSVRWIMRLKEAALWWWAWLEGLVITRLVSFGFL